MTIPVNRPLRYFHMLDVPGGCLSGYSARPRREHDREHDGR